MGDVHGVILVHAPGRRHYEFFEDPDDGVAMPEVASEIALIRAYGKEVLGIALNDEGLTPEVARAVGGELEAELGLPVALPLADGVGRLAAALEARLAEER